MTTEATEAFDYGPPQPDGQHVHHPVLTHGERTRPYRDQYTHRACGKPTTLGPGIAETYACDPLYYSDTFCSVCGEYFPIADFQWPDGQTVGT